MSMLHQIDRIDAYIASTGPIGPNDCEGCGDRGDLFHNEDTGCALCDACDQLAWRIPGLFSESAEERAASRQRYVVEYWFGLVPEPSYA